MKVLTSAIFMLGLLTFPSTSMSAWDCNGPWKVMRNSKTSPCKTLALNSRTANCRAGDKYEVFCDDDKGGKYRICQGTRRCPSARKNDHDCTYWDYNNDRPCPPGYRNNDCYGDCSSYRKEKHYYNCLDWDYYYDRPCPNGFKNYDCRGGCEPR
ncbi:hypothetical protein [Desulfosediminicola sp.]|uniref:hypothetical protein n=1 Tax=Desulfosediminicola sp. TaxID=2886825 RepID=UPI003AF29702